MNLDHKRCKKLKSLAKELGISWLKNSTIKNPNSSKIPKSREEAFFVQDKMAQVIGKDISGWKVGATSKKMRDIDGHDGIIPGRIFSSVTFIGSVHQLKFKNFSDARVETEFAFRLKDDIPIQKKLIVASDIENRVSMHPAVEIIGNRHILNNATKSEKSLMTIADNGGGIAFVFGSEFEDWKNINFRKHLISLKVDEKPSAENFLGDMRCEPLEAAVDLINHLSKREIFLKKGDFISTGATTVPQKFYKNSFVKADFGIIGEITLTFY